MEFYEGGREEARSPTKKFWLLLEYCTRLDGTCQYIFMEQEILWQFAHNNKLKSGPVKV